MGWSRGFVICPKVDAHGVEKGLDEAGLWCRFLEKEGKYAYAFAGRGYPEVRDQRSCIVTINARSIDYSWESTQNYRPRSLIPTLGATIGFAIHSNDAKTVHSARELRRAWRTLGPCSETEDNGKLVYFRWDIECSMFASKIETSGAALVQIGTYLGTNGIEYNLRAFQGGNEISECDIDTNEDDEREMDEREIEGSESLRYYGAAAWLDIRWHLDDGSDVCVTANEAEFIVDERLPDCEILEHEVWRN